MPRRFRQAVEGWDERLVLSTVAASAYFFFQLTVIWFALTGRGACQYVFWLPSPSDVLSPFWLSVVIAGGIFLWAVSGFVRSFRRTTERRISLLYYVFAIAIIGAWLYGLVGLWKAMQYERGQLSAEEFYSNRPGFIRMELYQCRGI